MDSSSSTTPGSAWAEEQHRSEEQRHGSPLMELDDWQDMALAALAANAKRDATE